MSKFGNPATNCDFFFFSVPFYFSASLSEFLFSPSAAESFSMSSSQSASLHVSSSASLPLSQQRHDVIALVSGGKDSFLALLHCLSMNYRIVALANLFPSPVSHASDTTDAPDFPCPDLNSHMYQTVGHALIPLYATALQIPVYRQPIRGSAVNSGREYFPPTSRPSQIIHHAALSPAVAANGKECENEGGEEDETESLLPLLQHIKTLHPTSTALCSGAIFSTYQRTRVESVALRANLQPLAPLWQYPCLRILRPPSMSVPTASADGEAGMLRDIVAVGLEARIVKVASGGLDAGVLWGDLRNGSTRERVRKGVERFGGSVVGEGGEFETLVLDGPSDVWKGGKILVEERERWIFEGEGGEAWMGFREGKVVERKIGEGSDGEDDWKKRLAVPELWEVRFETLAGRVEKTMEERKVDVHHYTARAPCQHWNAQETAHQTNCILHLSNLTAADSGLSAVAQMTALNARLHMLLKPYNLVPASTLSTLLLLRSMADFPSVNAVYATLFPAPLPPARVTVACGDALPAGVNVMATFVVGMHEGPDERQGLHVQSRSYWAPANIGPYSQAVEMRARGGERVGASASSSESALVFVAGQIPLVPMTMEPLGGLGETGWFGKHVCLALQHLWRIGRERRVMWWLGGVAYLVSGIEDGRKRARAAWLAWRMAHERGFETGKRPGEDEEGEEEEEEWDAWDRQYGGKGSFAAAERPIRLPDFEKVTFEGQDCSADGTIPGFFAVQVDELPRGCSIEWQAQGVKNGQVKFQQWIADSKLVHSSSILTCGTTMSYVGIPKQHSGLDLKEELSTLIDTLYRGKFTKGGEEFKEQTPLITIYTSEAHQVQQLDVQIIPCRAVWGRDGAELAAGLVIQS